MGDAGTRAFQRARLQKQQKKAIDGLLAAAREALESRRLTEAQFICGQILAFVPDHAEALRLLGTAQLEAGQLNDAEITLGRAIAAGSRSPELLCNRGAALFRLGRFADARELFQAALALNPMYLVALTNLAVALRRLDRHEEALKIYERALALAPKDAEIWYNCGVTYAARGLISDASRCYEEALRLDPRHVDALTAQAVMLRLLARLSAARELLDKALALRPSSHEALHHRAGLLLGLGDVQAALRDAEAAVALAPAEQQHLPLMVRAEVAFAMKDTGLAVSLAERVLRNWPDSARAFIMLATCRAAAGDVAEAVALFDRAIALAPDESTAISGKIFALDFLEGADVADQQAVRRLWWERIGSVFPRRRLDGIDADPERRLRVGYVSGDLRDHSAAFIIRPVLRCHDRTQVEVFAYSTFAKADDITEEFRALVDHWRDVAEMSSDALADCIMADRIDILVDCSGHTEGTRLPVFARKPAPIQVSAWGHPTGTGMPVMDYLFGDKVAIPDEVRPLFAEKVADLPCLITREPIGLPISPLPMLSRGHVTFGVFNRIDKLSDQAVAVWSRILAAISDARLIVKHIALDDPAVRQRLMVRFAQHGISTEHITFLGTSDRTAHLRAFDEVDISLDPFPQNGGISTWESLHMGVPVVAKLGNFTNSRVTASILTAVGLTDFVASDDDNYLEIATRFASQPEVLSGLRAGLPARIANSEAGDAVRYTRAVEAHYRRFWRDYCAAADAA
jgi:predicted O-linked N-acetylglucosamine transferase (SPINDLY family)